MTRVIDYRESVLGVTAPLLFVHGSRRSGSHTTRLLHALAERLPPTLPIEYVDLVGSLPWYDEDLEGDDQPDEVRVARRRIIESAGLVVATPEYNGGLPGGLKNVFDWATRPPKAHALVGKPVAVLGGSPNSGGARHAVDGLVGVLGYLGAIVVPDPLVVPKLPERFPAGGEPDEELEREISAFAVRIAETIGSSASS